MLPYQLEQVLIERRKGSHQSFTLHFFRQRILLLYKTQQKETQPIDQMRFIPIQSTLCTPQRSIVLLSVFFDNAFQRTVRHVSVARTQQQQIGQNSCKPAVAVLERMDREKANDISRHDEQGMMAGSRQLPVRPGGQFL